MNRLLIIGAGGHGKVVAEAAELTQRWDQIAFLDDRYPKIFSVQHWPVLERIHKVFNYVHSFCDAIVAIGDNQKRLSYLKELVRLGFRVPSIVHPTACVSNYSKISSGTVIFARAVVNIGTTIGHGVIVNTGAIVDHDCEIGAAAHISPGCSLAGGVQVGDHTWLGIGASVIQGVGIGANVIVGAGASIIRDIPDNVIVAGVPGKIIKEKI
jgi:sugar O-acyltransferase (sialic acid O-acetyltransferase NeuD family)